MAASLTSLAMLESTCMRITENSACASSNSSSRLWAAAMSTDPIFSNSTTTSSSYRCCTVQRRQIFHDVVAALSLTSSTTTSSSSNSSVSNTALHASAVEKSNSELESEAGISYEVLRQRLEAGEWEAADEETRRLLCVLAGEGAEKRKWVYFSEVHLIPSADLKVLDELWRQWSNNKFGYSVQRRIWKSVGGNWSLFFKKVGWTRALDEKNDIYKKFPVEFMWDVAEPTPDGHLPLTNALRGTQLLHSILTHPAFDDIERHDSLNA